MAEVIKVDDVDVHIDGEGEHLVLMVHGWPDNHRIWDGQVDYLSQRYRCARFSLPGFEPHSERGLVNLEQMMALLDRVIDATSNGQPITLLLHDWGCMYGYQYAMRHPDKVAHVIGVDIGDAGSKQMKLPITAKLGMLGYQLWLMMAWNIGGGLGDWMTKKLATLMGAPTPSSVIHSGMNYPYHWLWSGVFIGKNLGIKRVDIPMPFLFIYGGNKPANFHSNSWQQRIARGEGNQVTELAAGHWVMVDAAGSFNHTVAEWLGQRLEGAEQGDQLV